MSRISDIMQDLASSNWGARTRAEVIFLAITDRESLTEVNNRLVEKFDPNLALLFIRLLKTNLTAGDAAVLELAVLFLSQFYTSSLFDVSSSATEALDLFFSTDRLIQRQKNKVIAALWVKFDLKSRIYFTRKIGEHKFRSLLDFLVLGLLSNEKELQIMAIRAVKVLKDRRASGSLRTLLSSSDDVIIREVIQALGSIEKWSNYRSILPFLKHPKIEIRKTAINALIRLNWKLAVGDLVKAYEVETDENLKERICKQLGTIQDIRVVSLLVALLGKEESGRLRLALTWAINEVRVPNKLERIFKHYSFADLSLKLQLISLIGLDQGDKSFQFLFRLIVSDQPTEIKIAVLKTIARYNRHESIPVLCKIVLEGQKDLMPHAIACLFGQNCVSTLPMAEIFVPLIQGQENELTELLLKGILRSAELIESVVLEDFIVSGLQDSSILNRRLAIRCAANLPTEKCLGALITLVENGEKALSVDIIKSISEILKKKPELIKVHNKLFLIEEIYMGLDKSVFSERMFEQTLRSFDSDNVLWLINFVKSRGEDAIDQLFVYLKSVKEPRLQQSLLLLLDQTITRLSETNEKILLDKILSCQEAIDVRLILKMLERQGHSGALPVLMDTASRLKSERSEIFDSIRLILGRI